MRRLELEAHCHPSTDTTSRVPCTRQPAPPALPRAISLPSPPLAPQEHGRRHPLASDRRLSLWRRPVGRSGRQLPRMRAGLRGGLADSQQHAAALGRQDPRVRHQRRRAEGRRRPAPRCPRHYVLLWRRVRPPMPTRTRPRPPHNSARAACCVLRRAARAPAQKAGRPRLHARHDATCSVSIAAGGVPFSRATALGGEDISGRGPRGPRAPRRHSILRTCARHASASCLLAPARSHPPAPVPRPPGKLIRLFSMRRALTQGRQCGKPRRLRRV